MTDGNKFKRKTKRQLVTELEVARAIRDAFFVSTIFAFLISFAIIIGMTQTFNRNFLYQQTVENVCSLMNLPFVTIDHGVIYCSKSERGQRYSVTEGVAIITDTLYGIQKANQYDTRREYNGRGCASAGVTYIASQVNNRTKLEVYQNKS